VKHGIGAVIGSKNHPIRTNKHRYPFWPFLIRINGGTIGNGHRFICILQKIGHQPGVIRPCLEVFWRAEGYS
jgi:hypothetical protein